MTHPIVFIILQIVLLVEASRIRAPRKPLDTDDMDLLETLLGPQCTYTSTTHEAHLASKTPLRLALIADYECSVLKQMFEKLLVRRSQRCQEFASDEDFVREIEATVRDEEVSVLQVRDIPTTMELEAELIILFFNPHSQSSIDKLEKTVENLRLHNPRSVIGLMILNDGSSPHLSPLTSRLFDERCAAYLFDTYMDGETAWGCVQELSRMWADENRSGSLETRMAAPDAQAEESTGWWITDLISRYSACSIQ